MAEETTDTPKKKKKPVLLVVMVLAVLLLAGGFFVLKPKDTKGSKAKKIELGEKEQDLEEFLTNTSNPSVYVRAKITVRLAKTYDEAKFKGNTGDVRDAVILVLNSTLPSEVTDASKRSLLKRKLANAMNASLVEPAEGEDKKDEDEKPHHKKPKSASNGEELDSDTGPVMKVRFLSLATQ